MTPADVIALFDDPETLLRRCYLSIAGGASHEGPNGQAPLRTFSVAMMGDTMRGFTTGLSGFFGKQKDRPRVSITKLPGPAAVPAPPNHINAYYIPMVQVDDMVQGNSHYTLPTAGAASNIMLTSMITACVFSLGSDGNGAVLASHLQPPRIDGLDRDRRQDLAVTAGRVGFAHGQALTQVRHGIDYDMDSDRIAIVGRLVGPTWQFYRQKATRENGAFSVRSVVKIVEL